MKRIAISVALALFAGLMMATAASAQNTVSITSSFNSTDVPAGSYVWFNSNLRPSNLSPNSTTVITVTNATLNIAGTIYPIPNGQVTYDSDPNATFVPVSVYDPATNTWKSHVSVSTTANVFMTGLPIQFPAGLAGGQSPVIFTATFGSSTGVVTGTFQWGAAVYTQMPTDLNQLGVILLDNSGGPLAGTPFNYRQFLIPGARGNGDGVYTGDFSPIGQFTTLPGATPPPPSPTPTPLVTPSGTPPVTPSPTPNTVPEPATIVLFGSGILGLGGAAARRLFGRKNKHAVSDEDSE